MKDKRKKKKGWKKYVAVASFLLICVFFGYLIGKVVGQSLTEESGLGERLLLIAALLFSVYVAFVVHVILHEMGHLVFGLLSGYRFSSFRIFSLMWIKENGRIRFKRFRLAGTGGQCLMAPPDMVDGKFPVKAYNLGGSIMNGIFAVIFLLLYFAFSHVPLLSTVCLFFAAVGLISALSNGIPNRMGMLDNDGYNAFALSKSDEAMRAFWIQMKTNELLSKGVRSTDMPEEWFAAPSDEAMKNSMVAVIGVFACNRLMDEKRFEEADRLMEHMLAIESGIVGIHRHLLICERMYIELIGECRRDKIDEMFTVKQIKFMRQMRTFPSVFRTEYAYALLYEEDENRAEVVLALFERQALRYPYPEEIQAERELMERARQRFCERIVTSGSKGGKWDDEV